MLNSFAQFCGGQMCFIYWCIASDDKAMNNNTIMDGVACNPVFEKS